MKDPVRLLASGSPEAQALLRSAHVDVPSAARLEHLAVKLSPTVAAASAGAGFAPWLVVGGVLLGGAGAVLLGGAVGVMLARDHSRAPEVTPVPATDHVMVAPPNEPVPTPTPVEPASEVAQAPFIATPNKRAPLTRTTMPREPAAAATSKVVGPAPTAPARPPEMELLTPAHAALASHDPARALALAERHASLYATGVFAEEREAIAIEALHELGQLDHARARFAAFAASYPRSSYRSRLEHMIRHDG